MIHFLSILAIKATLKELFYTDKGGANFRKNSGLTGFYQSLNLKPFLTLLYVFRKFKKRATKERLD